MNPVSLPYLEGNNIVIYDSQLIQQALAQARLPREVPSMQRTKWEALQKDTANQNIAKSVFFKSFLKGAGSMCIFLSILGAIFTISPILYAQTMAIYQKHNFKNQVIIAPPENTSVPIADNVQESSLYTEQKKLTFIQKYDLSANLDWNFSLIIPKIGLNSKIIPNIDPSNKDEYMEALKGGVAHAKFTAFPSEEGIVYIFGHSTDYPWNIQTFNALFYSIKDLQENDQIFVLYNNKPYVYKTLYQKIIDEDNLVYLNAQTNAKMLVLQTCYPPGTTLKRLIVVAQLEESL